MSQRRKIIERLLIFIIGIPAVFSIVFLLPYYNHLALNIIVIIFCGIGAVELSFMLGKKGIIIPKAESFFLGVLAPLSSTLIISFNYPEFLALGIFMTGIIWALLSRVFSKKEDMDTVINHFVGCTAVMAYPGLFMYWLVRMSIWENSGSIFLFLLIVFFNDSIAWLIGSLFGKNNKGIIPASPNKSIAGFIGGIVGSVGVCIGAYFLFPSIFPFSVNLPSQSYIIQVIILGFATGIFATLGDLAESAIKRSSDFKDSGNVILGRGGILDSIDSIAAAAPVYYFLFTFLLNL